ncbi:hypothetical protein BDU57DRAFT_517957 [Ampelomyces quisqualis]|uniref:Uncharacterized protein n=1 Tax=Ampelomyces quisqualis TaxID=50730 RepID=A0A6A5QJW7_AMPQU|nr:hypothetical protein BDU57DRAFT_517957 [Ampelomyces quisqualis]
MGPFLFGSRRHYRRSAIRHTHYPHLSATKQRVVAKMEMRHVLAAAASQAWSRCLRRPPGR